MWDLQVIPFNSPVAEASNYDPELEIAFICHLHDHWFCIRKVNGEWYNFNSLYAAPEHLSKFYLSAFLDTLRGSGWSIFLVRGNFPKDCPIPSSNAFGQWLTPEDAQRITKSCNEHPQRQDPNHAYSGQFMSGANTLAEADALAAQEEHDLNAAIAASLMDTSNFTTGSSSVPDKGTSAGSPAIEVRSKSAEELDAAAVAASVMASAFSKGPGSIQSTGNVSSPAAASSEQNANESGSNQPQAADSNTAGESVANISTDPAEVFQTESTEDRKDQ